MTRLPGNSGTSPAFCRNSIPQVVQIVSEATFAIRFCRFLWSIISPESFPGHPREEFFRFGVDFSKRCFLFGRCTVGRKCSKMTHRGEENHSLTRTARSTPLRSAAHRSAPFRGAARRYTPLRRRCSTTLRSARGARSRVRKWRHTNEGSMRRFWILSAHRAMGQMVAGRQLRDVAGNRTDSVAGR